MAPIRWISTNGRAPAVSARTAILSGLAPDGGLYVPEELPKFSEAYLAGLKEASLCELAFGVASLLLDDEVPEAELQQIVERTCSFPVPLVQLAPGLSVLELFHGPTQAFKDFGARFFGELLSYFASDSADASAPEETVVLVATSGDTGGAVAHGLWNRKGVRVVVLYPKQLVSEIQELQITTLGGNVHALEVAGSFDDCQQLVKQAFNDPVLTSRLKLTSANSINIARLIPQTFYYLSAISTLAKAGDRPVTFVVPSGNFGNLSAGVIAAMMGAPIAQFVAATNANDTFPRYLEAGVYEPQRSKQTLANAMDVGNPSNFARLEYLFNHSHDSMKSYLLSVAVTDSEINEQIRSTKKASSYVLDPHTAVGVVAADKLQEELTGTDVVVLGTAHPGKFAPLVEAALGETLPMPEVFASLYGKTKQQTPLANDFSQLQEFLLGLAA